MNYLPHLVEPLIDLGLGPFHALLRQVHRISHDRAALLHNLRIAAVFHFDALGLEELTEVLVKFVFFNMFHNLSELFDWRQLPRLDSSTQLHNRGTIVRV